jgi:hypothetical protein
MQQSGSTPNAREGDANRFPNVPENMRVQGRQTAVSALENHSTMKLKSTLLGIACAIVTSIASAQMTTVTSSGTITEYSPGSTFIIKETTGPVSYRYGETITYVTRSGQPLSEEQVRTIRVGTPVNVHYVTEGDQRILNRVEVDEIEVDEDGEIEVDD